MDIKAKFTNKGYMLVYVHVYVGRKFKSSALKSDEKSH